MNNQKSIILRPKPTDPKPYRIIATLQYIIFKIVGLSPCSLSFPPSDCIREFTKNNSIRYSFPGTFYNIALIIGFCSYLGWSIDDLIPRKNPSGSAAKIGDNVHILGVAATASIWLVCISRQKLMISIVNHLVAVTGMLQRCKLFKFKDNSAIYWILLGNFLMTTFLLVLELLVYPPILVPIRYIPFLINSWILVQYSLLLDVLIKQLDSVCSTILRLGDVDTEVELQTLFVTKKPLRSRISHELIKIRDAHNKIFKISGMVSDFYGLPVLISVCYFGASTICYSYFVILSFFAEFREAISVNYFSFGSWLLMMIFGFVVMTTYVAQAIDRTEKTAHAVHLLLDRCTLDKRTYKDLAEFSCELLHQKMEFSAFGIMSFDGSLLETITGTIVTYLVILIQFRIQ